MSSLDPMTMSLATAVVVTVCGVIFLRDTVVHADSAAARIWSVGFMAGILTVVSYLAWTSLDNGWVAAGIGNGAFVATTGCMWLGCRTYNARRMRTSIVVVVVAVLTTTAATLAAGPTGGAWAGAVVMFPALAVLAGLGSAEARRAPLGSRSPALGLAIVLGVQCLYYVLRTPVFLVAGAESSLFLDWFGTPSTSVITIVLTITAVISMSVLRATERVLPRTTPETVLVLSDDGYLDARSFERVLSASLKRGGLRREPVAVIALRLEGLTRIAAAFGAHQAQQITTRWRDTVQIDAPLSSFLGDGGSGVLLVGVASAPETAVKRLAGRLSQRVLDELTATETTISPILGVGVALSKHHPDDPAGLIAAAAAAAHRSAGNLDAAVVLDRPGRGLAETQSHLRPQ